MLVNIDDYELQVKLFTEHLGQKRLAGFIIDTEIEGASKVSVYLNKKDYYLKETENLYVVPQVGECYGTVKDVKSVRTLILDIDEYSSDRELNFDGFQPNLVIRRTDKRAYQAFYFLDHEIGARDFKKYQTALFKKYGGDKSLTNVNRGARLAGVRRGDKSKDKAHNIESGLHYEIISHHTIKATKADVLNLIGAGDAIDSDDRNNSDNNDSSSTYFPALTDDGLEKYSGAIYGRQEDLFKLAFAKRTLGEIDFKVKGDKTTNTLLRFACSLERSMPPISLNQFKKYCDEVGVDACGISSCDEEEFKRTSLRAKELVKQEIQEIQEKKAEEKSKKAASHEIDSTELYEKYPDLRKVKSNLDLYYFVEDQDIFYREEPGKRLTKISKNTFNFIFKEFIWVRSKEGKRVPVSPSYLFVTYNMRNHFNVAATTTYVPHSPRLIDDGRKLLNTWSYPVLEQKDGGDLTIFLQHIEWLFEGQFAIDGLSLRDFFLDYLAYVYCNPTAAKFAWLLYAQKMGIGRSFFTDLFANLMGEQNVSTPTPRIAQEKYSAWHSSKQLAVVEELMSDNGFYDELKPVIGNERVAHREMHKDSVTGKNYCNMILLSNKIECLKIAEGDRRILVVHMHQDVKSKSYYNELYGWKKKPENLFALSEYLKERNKKVDVSRMLDHAPITQAKVLMQRVNKDSTLQELEALVAEKSFGDFGQFVAQRELVEALFPNIQDTTGKNKKSVAYDMIKIGYVPVFVSKNRRIVTGADSERVTIYVKTSLAEKYVKEEHFEKIIDLYREFRAKKQRDIEDVPLKKGVEHPQVEYVNTPIVYSPVISNDDSPAVSEKNAPKKSAGSQKINDLVKEARRRAAGGVEKALVTIEDLLRIRDERTRQYVDISFLYK